MLLIPCPHCGPRDEGEFAYGGPKRKMPDLDGTHDTQTWQKALHLGHNPRGAHVELWYHSSGCETWIEVTRNPSSHEITPQTKGDEQ